MVSLIVELMKRISFLSQYKVFWYILCVLSLCIASWLHGNHYAYKVYQEKITNESRANLEALRRFQEESQEREDNIVKDYLSQIEELKTKQEDISEAKISDVIECPKPVVTRVYINKTDTNRTVSKEKTKSNLLCYTESQLRDKIKESMDIGKECDELVIKYKSLYEVCK